VTSGVRRRAGTGTSNTASGNAAIGDVVMVAVGNEEVGVCRRIIAVCNHRYNRRTQNWSATNANLHLRCAAAQVLYRASADGP